LGCRVAWKKKRKAGLPEVIAEVHGLPLTKNGRKKRSIALRKGGGSNPGGPADVSQQKTAEEWMRLRKGPN